MSTKMDCSWTSSSQMRHLNKLFVITMLFMSSLALGCSDKAIVINGVIRYPGTQKPVPNARAILTIVSEGHSTLEVMRYAMTSDSKGKLDAHIQPIIRPTKFYLEVCGKSNEYAVLPSPKVGFSLAFGNIPNSYKRMYEQSSDEPWLKYENFGGASKLLLDEPIEFLDKRWASHRGN